MSSSGVQIIGQACEFDHHSISLHTDSDPTRFSLPNLFIAHTKISHVWRKGCESYRNNHCTSLPCL